MQVRIRLAALERPLQARILRGGKRWGQQGDGAAIRMIFIVFVQASGVDRMMPCVLPG